MNFSEVKALITYLREILISGGTEEKILIDIISELSGFKVTGQKLSPLDMFNKVVSMSDRFPLLSKLLSISAVLPTSISPCERILMFEDDEKQIYVTATSMNDFMMITISGQSMKDFNALRYVEH
jgi:hypothetical protein